MAWLILAVAGVFEVVWAMGLKYSHGFTKLGPSVFTLIAMAISIYLLAIATKTLPIGTAYAVWTGIGAIGAVIMGIILFRDPTTWQRLLFVGLILSGIIGLKITSAS